MSKGRQTVIDAHKQLFALLYHLPLSISNTDFLEARTPLEALVTVADMYGCFAIAEHQVNNHLLHFRANRGLYDECWKNIQQMLDFAVKVRSAWIYKQVMVHILNSPDPSKLLGSDLGLFKGIFLVKSKREALIGEIKTVNQDILLRTGYKQGEGADETPTVMLARAYFRDWFSQKVSKHQCPPLQRGYAKVYRLIRAEMTPPEFKVEKWLKQAGQSEKIKIDDFMHELQECFTSAGELIKPLMANPNEVNENYGPDADSFEAPLVCIPFSDYELPWRESSIFGTPKSAEPRSVDRTSVFSPISNTGPPSPHRNTGIFSPSLTRGMAALMPVFPSSGSGRPT